MDERKKGRSPAIEDRCKQESPENERAGSVGVLVMGQGVLYQKSSSLHNAPITHRNEFAIFDQFSISIACEANLQPKPVCLIDRNFPA